MIPLQQIHQIEITSRCNLKCHYCVHRSMAREKIDMTEDTFKRAITWAKFFKERGTQGSLNLAGIGESTMHPNFIDFIAHARTELGEDQELVLATNGVNMTPELAAAMKWAGGGSEKFKVFVSLHRPEKAGPAINMLAEAGLMPSGASADPALHATDWAGQIKWKVTAKRTPCPWVRGGWGVVLSDGRISRCSFDGTGIGVFAHVNDDLSTAQTSPYSLCRTCHQNVGLPIPEEVAA